MMFKYLIILSLTFTVIRSEESVEEQTETEHPFTFLSADGRYDQLQEICSDFNLDNLCPALPHNICCDLAQVTTTETTDIPETATPDIKQGLTFDEQLESTNQ